MGLSEIEYKLQIFMERLTSAMTEEITVEVLPGDRWISEPQADPPRLTYRTSDIAVMGERILPLVAHEISVILFTTPYEWNFEIGKRTKTAKVLMDVVEGGRVDRIFSDVYSGAASLFERSHGDGAAGIWKLDVVKGFGALPAKWRFLLNVDRMLWGLPALGSDSDIGLAEEAYEDCVLGALSPTTQECADHLELPIKLLNRAINRERKEKEALRRWMKEKDQPLDVDPSLKYINEPESTRDDEDPIGESDHSFEEGAEEDDGQPGGLDGTPGSRKDGGSLDDDDEDLGFQAGMDGPEHDSDAEPGEGCEPSGSEGNGDADGEGDPDAKPGTGESSTPNEYVGDLSDDDDDDEKISPADQVKATNILEQMVEDMQYSENRAIKHLKREAKQRAAEGKRVRGQMDAQNHSILERSKGISRGKSNRERMERLLANAKAAERDAQRLAAPILTMKNHALTVLRDNAATRYGGSFESGRHIKRHRLHRVGMGIDEKPFSRRVEMGAKSYAIALCVDQSGSMSGAAPYWDDAQMVAHAQRGDQWPGRTGQAVPQQVAYECALILLEGFGVIPEIDIIIVGFTDFIPPKGSYGGQWDTAKIYATVGDDLRVARSLLPEMRASWESTPLEEGLRHSFEELMRSEAQVKVCLTITDGVPNNEPAARVQAARIERAGIHNFGILLKGPHSSWARRADEMMQATFERYAEVETPQALPASMYGLLHAVVQRATAIPG